MKKINISIVITAYKSEEIISGLLADIFRQQLTSTTISKIYIISDNCPEIKFAVSQFKNNKIVYLQNKNRVGKEKSLNRFLDKYWNKGPFLFFDDDVRMFDKNVVEQMGKKLIEGGDLVCGKHIPLNPVTLVEKAAYFGVEVWENAINLVEPNADRYKSTGQIRAISKRFAKSFRFKENRYIAEDTYAFYFAKKYGYTVLCNDFAKIYHRLPQTYWDYVKQMRRFIKADSWMEQEFGSELSKKYNTITTRVKMISLFKKSLTNPFMAILYIILQTVPKIHSKFYHQPAIWEISLSTKNTNV